MNAKQSLKIWRKTLRRDAPSVVGKFFESLSFQLFSGGECDPSEADFACWGADVAFEVKASDNNNPFRLRVDQLLSHVNSADIRFPCKTFVYGLFKYKNRETVGTKGVRKSLLSRCKTPLDMKVFLAQQPITLHILDIRMLELLLKRDGSSKNCLPAMPDADVIKVGHSLLQRFSTENEEDRAEVMREVGLRRNQWIITKRTLQATVQDGLLTYPMRIEVTSVLRQAAERGIESIFPKVRLSVSMDTL